VQHGAVLAPFLIRHSSFLVLLALLPHLSFGNRDFARDQIEDGGSFRSSPYNSPQ
jgi:hypothetical protein